MALRAKQLSRPADVNYLVRELRRLSTEPPSPHRLAFWKIVRGHLSQRRSS